MRSHDAHITNNYRYGGEVVYEFDRDEADHVISSQPSATGKVCVTITMCVCY